VSEESHPAWRNLDQRSRHFRKHRRRLRLRTVAEYEESALDTIRVGVRFEYFDPPVNQWQVGYYDPPTSRFTALNDDEAVIETHFTASESYVRNLVRSNYPL
jgi:hypothetical protein